MYNNGNNLNVEPAKVAKGIVWAVAGIVLVIWSLCRPKVEIAFPDRYADEPSDGKRRR